MRTLFVAVVALLAVPFSAAWGQVVPTPTPTPTPTVTPTPEPTPDPEAEERAKLRKRPGVKKVYRDFERDGRVETCDHRRKVLRRTLRSVEDDYDADFPDFRPTLRAAIRNYGRELRRCEREEQAAAAPPTPAPTQVPQTTPDPVDPVPTTDPGELPELDFGGGGDDDRGGGSPAPPEDEGPAPPTEGDVAPIQPTPAPAPTPGTPAEPQLVVTRPDGDTSLLFPALLLAAALLGLGLTGASAVAARRGGRLEGWGHAWREAAYRTTGAWGDFSDWLRLGR